MKIELNSTRTITFDELIEILKKEYGSKYKDKIRFDSYPLWDNPVNITKEYNQKLISDNNYPAYSYAVSMISGHRKWWGIDKGTIINLKDMTFIQDDMFFKIYI